MQNEFEKKWKQEMETFSLEPNKEVWQRVSLRIRKDKERKRIFIFWMIASFLLVGGTFYAYHFLNASKSSGLITNAPQDNNTKPAKKLESINKDALSINNNKETPEQLKQVKRNLVKKDKLSSQNIPLQEITKVQMSDLKKSNPDLNVLESTPTTIAGKPAHKIVFSAIDNEEVERKAMQV